MAHPQQMDFCKRVKAKLPEHFVGKRVLDVGSLDINGNNRFLFENCSYFGIDVGEGKNVDKVCKAHELDSPDGSYDTIISTECFEHDQHYALSLQNIVRMLTPGGLFLFTCATEGRPEHGTRRTDPNSAPLLAAHGDWFDYYKNLTEKDIRQVLHVDAIFSEFAFFVNSYPRDLYFYGVKKQ
jgi:SAM-dependent methyltransferase